LSDRIGQLRQHHLSALLSAEQLDSLAKVPVNHEISESQRSYEHGL
jgi:hypothetical protein